MDGEQEIKLVSKDGDAYVVPIKVAKMSKLVVEQIAKKSEPVAAILRVPGVASTEVHLPNVSSPVLKKVIDYCEHYQEEEMTTIQTPFKSSKLEELVQKWYADFVKIPKNLLFELIAAANYMGIDPLYELTCLAHSFNIKGKSATELSQYCNTT